MSDETQAETITLANEIGRQRFVLANAEDEIAFQLAINQQIGAENERLYAENAAMRPIVAAVAGADAHQIGYGPGSTVYLDVEHSGRNALRLREQARAFVAAHPAGEG